MSKRDYSGWPNPHGRRMNCLRCGRDTKARDGLCTECGGRKRQPRKCFEEMWPELAAGAEDNRHLGIEIPSEDDYSEQSYP